MNLHDFFRGEEPRKLLVRAARSAGTPLSLHRVEEGEEGPLEGGSGACGICTFVHRINGGPQACRRSRFAASEMALRQRRALAFTCHMGLTCVAAPALSEGNRVLTFGPYCPAGVENALAEDIADGLRALGAGHVIPPLDDLHRAPPGTVTTIAEWTREALDTRWRRTRETLEERTDDPSEPPPAASRRRAPASRHREPPYGGAAIAAALAGGNQPQARNLLRGVLDEAGRSARTRIEERRARLVAAVSAALEVLARTGLSEPAWEQFTPFIAAVRAARDDTALLDAAMVALGAVRRSAKPRGGKDSQSAVSRVSASLPRLNAILTRRIDAPLTLEEVARELGETPSAISHRLRNKFGMSFSEYRGRLRIEKAKELLRRTRLSATVVARRVGIADQSNFGKLFKKFEGLSPLEYRKQHGKI